MKNLSAEDILKIPITNPEKLFTGNLDIAKTEYHDFCKFWHTDVNNDPNAGMVFSHIHKLYEEVKKLITSNRWKGSGNLVFKTKDKKFNIFYSKVKSFEIGDCYIGKTDIVYVIKREFAEFFTNAKSILSHLSFADADMKRQMEKFIPVNSEYLSTKDDLIMIIPKTEDMIPLSDLLEHFNGKIDPLHIAWIINSLYNICCYLNYAKVVHLNIDLETCFISPKHHAIYLFGGWWFSKGVNHRITTLPIRTVETLSPDIFREKIAKNLIDLDMIRFLGRELLGDRAGEHLKYNKDIPPPMVRWLRASTTEDAILDYKLWKNVLEECFGRPKFIEMSLDINLFY